jgi:hypothetical protein
MEATPMAEFRPIETIAREIATAWGVKVNYAARPYLRAMLQLNSIDDHYGADPARCVVTYFLANARTWKGDTAKRIKAELIAMVKTPTNPKLHYWIR